MHASSESEHMVHRSETTGTPQPSTPADAGDDAAPAWQARIHVTLKPVVLDPQGEAVLHSLRQLGFATVAAVRVGKYLEVNLHASDHAAAQALVQQMCERLLANPVIESYHFSVESVDSPCSGPSVPGA